MRQLLGDSTPALGWRRKRRHMMVPGARIELATPAFSGRRSTNELPRLFNDLRVGKNRCVSFCVSFGTRLRQAGASFEKLRSVLQVPLVGDVVAVKHRARLVA